MSEYSVEEVCTLFADSSKIQDRLRQEEIDGSILEQFNQMDFEEVGFTKSQAKAVVMKKQSLQWNSQSPMTNGDGESQQQGPRPLNLVSKPPDSPLFVTKDIDSFE